MTNPYNQSIFTSGSVTYTDVDFNFRQNPITDDVVVKTDAEAVKQSLRNILFTERGDKPFQPEFGSGLSEMLFQPLDEISSSIIESSIRTTIENYEPRVRLRNIKVAQTDMQELSITIEYNIINVFQPQSLTLILQRVR